MDGKSYSSTLPLDIGQLNSITEGKNTFQEELLEMFFSGVSDCLGVMESNCVNGECEKWSDALDELKSTSASIGALELAKICAVAQKITTSTTEEKQRILANIKSNVHKLSVFIRNTRY
jgi:HPt (histidine-containing phosphotransfer) domain-containing protein